MWQKYKAAIITGGVLACLMFFVLGYTVGHGNGMGMQAPGTRAEEGFRNDFGGRRGRHGFPGGQNGPSGSTEDGQQTLPGNDGSGQDNLPGTGNDDSGQNIQPGTGNDNSGQNIQPGTGNDGQQTPPDVNGSAPSQNDQAPGNGTSQDGQGSSDSTTQGNPGSSDNAAQGIFQSPTNMDTFLEQDASAL